MKILLIIIFYLGISFSNADEGYKDNSFLIKKIENTIKRNIAKESPTQILHIPLSNQLDRQVFSFFQKNYYDVKLEKKQLIFNLEKEIRSKEIEKQIIGQSFNPSLFNSTKK